MIPRLRGAIAYSLDTKLPGEDGEDAATDWGTRPNQEAKSNPETLQPMVGGIVPTPRKILLGSKSKIGVIIDSEKGEKSDLSSHPLRRSRLWNVKRINKRGVSEVERPRKGVYPSHGGWGPYRWPWEHGGWMF